MQTHDGRRSDERPRYRTLRALMEASRPFQGVAVPRDEKVTGESLVRPSHAVAPGGADDSTFIRYQDLLFGVGMGIC